MAFFLCFTEGNVIVVTDSEVSRKKFLANCVFIFKFINICPFCFSVNGKYSMREILSQGFFFILYLVLVPLLHTLRNAILGVLSAGPGVGLDDPGVFLPTRHIL